MGKRRYSSDDDSDDELDCRSLSSSTTKRSRHTVTNGLSPTNNDEYYVSQGKCSVCGLDTPPTYHCIKCHKVFHESCDNFRIENETSGICGSCLLSIILECPCCHQRGFKGIHGLRTHIGGYCKKQHSKDWRQQFKDFLSQLEKRIESIGNKDVSAISIIHSYRHAAKAVASLYGCNEDTCLDNTANRDSVSKQLSLQDYVNQIQAHDHGRSRKSSRNNDLRDCISTTSSISTPLLPASSTHSTQSLDRTPTEKVTSEETANNYNLRHKSSTTGSLRTDETSSQTSTQPFLLSPLEKSIPQNAIMDCPFCEKSGYCGLSGIRTHIRNYCPSIDKLIWREKFVKCIKYNIKKYEELNRLPNANVEYNKQVIAFLKTKENPDENKSSKQSSSKVTPKENVVVGVMKPIQYEKVYCDHCNDENSSCAYCGCHTCHFKHLASLLLICDECNKEHHFYCISPQLKEIPEGAWYCPECQKKRGTLNGIYYKDRNYTLKESDFSTAAWATVNSLQQLLQQGPVDKETFKSLTSSLSIPELLQVQSYFTACSNRLCNKLIN